MNRYSMLAASMILMIAIIVPFTPEDNNIELTGYADNIHQTEKGYTFDIHDADGNTMRAFSKIDVDGSLHVFRGSYSSDGTMFFIDGIS